MFSVVYHTSNGAVTLIENQAHLGQVIRHEYNYYMFPLQYKYEDFTIALTAFSGDPDLYIFLSPDNPQPTRNSYDFRSRGIGSDVITIPWGGGIQSKCPALPDVYNHGDPTHCMVYLGVYGQSPSHYSIVVYPTMQIPSALI